MKTITFVKETNKEMTGGILCFKDGTFEAFTMVQAKNYKTIKGATNFLNKAGYFEAPAVAEADPTVLDLTGSNANKVIELKERFIGNWNSFSDMVQKFILKCDSYSFTGNSLLLYVDRKIVAEGMFYVKDGKVIIETLGAGEVFQWSRSDSQKEEVSEVVSCVGYLIQVKMSEETYLLTTAGFDELPEEIAEAHGIKKIKDNLKAQVGVWKSFSAKVDFRSAEKIFKDNIKLNPSNNYRLLRCKIKYNSKSNMMLADQQPEIYKVIKQTF